MWCFSCTPVFRMFLSWVVLSLFLFHFFASVFVISVDFWVGVIFRH